MEDKKDKTNFTKEEVEQILIDINSQKSYNDVKDEISLIADEYNLNIYKKNTERVISDEEPKIEDDIDLDDNLDIDDLLENEDDF